MTNQEAMRGRAEDMLNQMMASAAKLSTRSIKGPTIPQIADKITEFTLQEVASRDARIEKLEAALKDVWMAASDVWLWAPDTHTGAFVESMTGLRAALDKAIALQGEAL